MQGESHRHWAHTTVRVSTLPLCIWIKSYVLYHASPLTYHILATPFFLFCILALLPSTLGFSHLFPLS